MIDRQVLQFAWTGAAAVSVLTLNVRDKVSTISFLVSIHLYLFISYTDEIDRDG